MKRGYGSKPPSKAHKRTMLGVLLISRENLDDLPVESVARSHGLDVAEVIALRSAELRRREAGR